MAGPRDQTSQAPKADLRSRATRGVAWNHLYKIVEYGLINIFTILLARYFGPVAFAPFALYVSAGTTLALTAAFAVDGVLLRYTPRVLEGYRGEDPLDPARDGIRPFLRRLFAFRIVVVTVLSAVIVAAIAFLANVGGPGADWIVPLQSYSPYLIVYLFAQSCVMFATFTLLGLLQVKWVFWASLISRGALVLIGFLLIEFANMSVGSAIMIHALATVLNAVLLLVWMRNQIHAIDGQAQKSGSIARSARRIVSEVRTLLGNTRGIKLFLGTPIMLYGITTWGSDILSTVLGRQPDIIMMGLIFGQKSAEIGYYQVAAIVVLMAEYVFLFGLGGTLVSVFSALGHKDERETPGEYVSLTRARKEIAQYQVAMTTPVFAYVIVFAQPLIEMVFGSRYQPSVAPLQAGVLINGLTVILFGGGLQFTTLVAVGRERRVFKNRLLWGAINVVANFFLISKLGALGAMIGTQTSNSLACGVEAYIARRVVGSWFPTRLTLTVVAISTACAVGSFYLATLIANVSALAVSLIGLGLMVASTFGLYHLFRVPEAKKLITKLLAAFRGARSREHAV